MASGIYSGNFDITPVDVSKPLALMEQVRQNRMLEELKTYQIAKARREDAAQQTAGQHILGALGGDKAALAELMKIDPQRGMAVVTFLRDADERGLNQEYKRALIENLRRRMSGAGAGTAGSPVFGGPVGPSPVAAPPGMPRAGAPVAPVSGPPAGRPAGRPTPTFGYGVPGAPLPGNGGGDDTSGQDVPLVVPSGAPPSPLAPSADRFGPLATGAGGFPVMDPDARPEGESGQEPPPVTPVVPVQAPPGPAPAAPPDRSVRPQITADDARQQGFVEFVPQDKYQKSVVEAYLGKGFVLMKGPDGRVKPFPMVAEKPTGEKWRIDPNDPRFMVSATGDRKLAPQVDQWEPDPSGKFQINKVTGERKKLDEPDKLTESQAKDFSYALRLARSIPEMEKMAYAGQRPTGVQRFLSNEPTVLGVPVTGGALQAGFSYFAPEDAAKAQKFDQISRDMVNAMLRRESGAVISPSEFDNAKRQYIPQPGDTPDVVQFKLQNLRTQLEAFAISSGKPDKFGFNMSPSLDRPKVPGPPDASRGTSSKPDPLGIR